MNKFKYYTLHFKHHRTTESLSLKWRLVDSPVAATWSEIIEKYYNEGITRFEQNLLELNINDPNIWDVSNNWNIILDNSRYLDSVDYPHKELFDIKPENNIFSAHNNELLNEVHKKFHYISERLMETTKNYPPDKPYGFDFNTVTTKLSEINIAVHRIEHVQHNALDGKTNSIPNNSGFVNVKLPQSHKHEIEISNELKTWFNHYDPKLITRPGDLWLSYATVGKNLWGCYNDNDVLLVKEKGVRPQRYVKNYYAISFGAREKVNVVDRIVNILQWSIKNNLLDYIPLDSLSSEILKDPILAQLIVPLQSHELNYVFLNYSLQSFSIE